MKYLPNILPYSGAKQDDMLVHIFELLPKDKHFVLNDHFGGSGSLSVNVAWTYPKSHVRYNELDENVFSTIESLQEWSPEIICDRIEWAIERFNLNDHNEKGFEEFKAWFNKTNFAIRDHFLNALLVRHAFSCLPRWNSNNEYNVKFGDRTWHFNNFWKYVISETNHVLQSIELHNEPYTDFMDLYCTDYLQLKKPMVIHYFDPPYLITDAVYNNGWNEDSERELLRRMDEIVERGEYFILSNVVEHRGKENRLLKEWLTRYNVRYIDKHYALARSGKDENATKEVLVSNLKFKERGSLENFL